MPHQHYLEFIERVNTPRRFQHSLGVMQVMGELAEVYALDRELAETTGLLHDAAKDISPELIEQLMQEGGIEIQYECEHDYVYYLHGPVGAYYVHKELGINDSLILDAITSHTYCGDGAHFTHPLTWCLRFADMLEPGRNWSRWAWVEAAAGELRTLVYGGKLDEAAYLLTSMLLRWFPEMGIQVHPHTRRVNQELKERLKLEASFLDEHKTLTQSRKDAESQRL